MIKRDGERKREEPVHATSDETSICVCECDVGWGGREVGCGRQKSVCVCVYEMGPQCVYVGGL